MQRARRQSTVEGRVEAGEGDKCDARCDQSGEIWKHGDGIASPSKTPVHVHLDIRVLLPEVQASASDGAACADASDENVHLAPSGVPHFGASGTIMDLLIDTASVIGME